MVVKMIASMIMINHEGQFGPRGGSAFDGDGDQDDSFFDHIGSDYETSMDFRFITCARRPHDQGRTRSQSQD